MSPVCLPKARDEPEIYENVRAVAIGWGTVNVSTGEMPQKLQVIFYEIQTIFIYSKFVQLELPNKEKARSSKNMQLKFFTT